MLVREICCQLILAHLINDLLHPFYILPQVLILSLEGCYFFKGFLKSFNLLMLDAFLLQYFYWFSLVELWLFLKQLFVHGYGFHVPLHVFYFFLKWSRINLSLQYSFLTLLSIYLTGWYLLLKNRNLFIFPYYLFLQHHHFLIFSVQIVSRLSYALFECENTSWRVMNVIVVWQVLVVLCQHSHITEVFGASIFEGLRFVLLVGLGSTRLQYLFVFGLETVNAHLTNIITILKSIYHLLRDFALNTPD